MNTKQALAQATRLGMTERRTPYRYRPGRYTLTTSFASDAVSVAVMGLAARLVEHFSARQVGKILGTSASTVSKMVRIYHAGGARR